MTLDLSILGISEKKESQLNKKNIYSIEDLISFYPIKYYNFSKPVTSRGLPSNTMCSMLVKVRDVRKYPSYVLVKAVEYDSRDTIYIKWFRSPYKYKELLPYKDENCIVCGMFESNEYGLQFNNPIVFSTNIEKYKTIFPVYSNIPNMSDEFLKNTIRTALDNSSLVIDEKISV